MKDIPDFNEATLGLAQPAVRTDAPRETDCCAVCGRAPQEMDWDQAAGDPAFYYLPTEVDAAPPFASTILNS